MNIDERASFRERQDSEFELLQSIYNNDIIDIRTKDAWKVWRPPEFFLKLKPQEGMSGKKNEYVYLNLHVDIPPRYPECSPDLKIKDSKGLSTDDLSKLEKQLKEFCKSAIGEVMILEVAQMIQEFLHKHDVPRFTSFYEEMVQNRQKQLEKEEKEETERKLLQQKKEQQQIRLIREERARIEEEKKKLRKIKRAERDVVPGTAGVESSKPDNANFFSATGVTNLQFAAKVARNIIRGQKLGSGKNGSVVHIGMDTSSGQVVTVHHWTIACPGQSPTMLLAERNKLDKYLKAVSTIDQEIQSLVKLSHRNIVAYIAMKNTRTEKSIEVDVLQEYIAGISLQQKISSKERVPLDVLRHYTQQMLIALEYLHSKSVVHKQFKASSVFLDSEGLVKVADFSIGKRLVDLYAESRIEQPGVRFTDDRIPTKISKKGDILRLGIVTLSLAQGLAATDYPPEISSAFTPVFQDFLEKCLTIDEKQRWNSSDLLQHEFVKPSIVEVTSPIENLEVLNSGSDDENLNLDVCASDTEFGTKGRTPKLSRLHSEFQELEWLGKGGYGDVVKVRNKLDDCHYAIKRILLKPSQSQFNKKITREVKLLSRLNHEHVVRYYNSWIETIQSYREDVSTNSSSNYTTTSESKPSKDRSTLNSLGLTDDIEKFAPPPVQSSVSEWSMSLEEVSRHGELVDDDDDEDVFKTIYLTKDDSSDSVLFDRSSDESCGSDEEAPTDTITTSTNFTTDTNNSNTSLVTRRYFYIQMEYCEKSTLRDTIDDGLCHESERMWRLFREILEGLSHVHQQGMIHRDLKPQNIFLDINDHVKIGDFGLATSRSKVVSNNSDDASCRSEGVDSTYTGAVGTGLYVAPEILASSKRTLYSQKVDIYSLGIIFFEMFYSGMNTKMERVKVLGRLREPSINFPLNFDHVSSEKEAAITKWCLNHEPSERPTALELLKSRWVPTPVLEESDVLDAVREMLSDPRSKQHRIVMDEIFNKPINPSYLVVYNHDLYKHFSIEDSTTQQKTFQIVSSLLERHGATYVNTPLILSRLKLENATEAATFLDSSGTVVALPYNLRVPFARLVVCNGISSMKRYAIEKVFRARKIRGSHPKEIWECAFDIVTPTVGGLIPDAEAVSVVAEIISDFPVLASRKYSLRINHVMTLKAILRHCGLEDDKHEMALTALATIDGLSKRQIDACLSGLPLNQKNVSTLAAFVQVRGPLSKVQAQMKGITKNKSSEASSLARQGLHEMEIFQKNLEMLQVNLPVTYDLGFCHKYHQHYNGIVFQVSAEIQKKRHTAIEILAIGGRYDALLESVDYLKLGNKSTEEKEDKSANSHVVGVSVAIEKVVAAMSQECGSDGKIIDEDLTSPKPSSLRRFAPVDVFIYSMGRSQNSQARLKILKSLWLAGIKAETSYDQNPSMKLEDIQKKQQERGVGFLVVLNEKENLVLVKSFKRDQNIKAEHKTEPDKLVDYLKRCISSGNEEENKKSSNQQNASSGDFQKIIPPTNHGGTRHLTIEIVAPDKLSFNTKKRYEFEIRAKLANLSLIQSISSKTTLCAIAVDLPSLTLKQLGCSLDLSHGEENFHSSVAHHLHSTSRHKKYLKTITDRISEIKFNTN